MNRPRTAVFVAGMFVVTAALAATAHGMYVTARDAADLPWFIAWLYPAMFDFLALVGYGGAHWLRRWARIYAWSVVVTAALLSGLAQAENLSNRSSITFDTELAYWLGWWPPIGGLIAVHLLYLIWRIQPDPVDDNGDNDTDNDDEQPPNNDDVWAQFDDHGTNRAWDTAPPAVDTPPVEPQPISLAAADNLSNDDIITGIVKAVGGGEKLPTPWAVRQRFNVGPTRAQNIITAAQLRLAELQESTP